MSTEIAVVKFGSEVICGETGLEQETIYGYAGGLLDTFGPDGLVVVSSGAVRTGESIVRTMRRADRYDFEEPTLAQIGNVAVMAAWQEAFYSHGVLAGEVLTTHREISDPNEGPVLVETIMMAADRGVVSVVNNNDANSRDELESFHSGKDNDQMALHIAKTVGASVFGIYTKGGGVFDDEGVLIAEINSSNYNSIMEMLLIREASGYGTSESGTGGITSKVPAATEAAKYRMESFIAAPNKDMTGENVTRFVW